MRIEDHPILTIKKQDPIPFTYQGKTYYGVATDSIASALVANGIKVFSFSSKRHRPRGFYCAIGNCAACKMTVDGVADVRTCITPLKANIVVSRQENQETEQ